MTIHMAKSTLIVGIGGTPNPESSSGRALRHCLERAKAQGSQTLLFTGSDLLLPVYQPGPEAKEIGKRMLDAIRRADGIIFSSPSYHGSVAGFVKNAIDYIEELRQDERVYLEGRAVGCVVCASGPQAIGTTLTALRSVVHSLRGWPTPLGVGINVSEQPRSVTTTPGFNESVLAQLNMLTDQILGFAHQKLALKGAA